MTVVEAGDLDTQTLAFFRAMDAIGYQPFILIDAQKTDCHALIICKTQQFAPEFVHEIAHSPLQPRSAFLRGVRAALQLEYYDAAVAFFDWIEGVDRDLSTAVHFFDGGSHQVRYSLEYPAFAIMEAPGGDATLPADRAQALLSALVAYDRSIGNDAMKWCLIEGMALGLSKHYGNVGEFVTARDAVKVALKHAPKSIHLRAAEHALDGMIGGTKVPDRLMKFIGPDNGALRRHICPEPFKRFDIGPSGDVLVCCGHWVPTTIGNFMTQEIDAILSSETAKKIRASVLDGSFKYCNHLECMPMIQGYLPTKEEVTDTVLRDAIDAGKLTIDSVDQVLFAFDQSCNLSCPSCRRERIIEKPSLNQAKAAAVEQKLLPLLKNLRTLNLNPAGEVFSSKPSRRLLELVSRETCPDLNIDIISNGTLFTEKEWNKLPNLKGMVRSVRISTDAATAPTFEKLRRLAKWDVFTENLAFLGRLRQGGGIGEFKLSFTYQLDNFHEMAEFVAFAQRYHCDMVIFERLQNLGAFTWDEFRERAVHLREHPLHAEFLDIIKNPIFAQRMVYHDFEWKDAAVLSPEEAKARATQFA